MAKMLLCSCVLLVSFVNPVFTGASDSTQSIQPLLGKGSPADWWFAFKFNGKQFPGCAGDAQPACPFGGDVQHDDFGQSQQFVYASSENQKLTQGSVCLGDSDGAAVTDPLGATFAEIYNGDYHYVVWNDQFYEEPKISGCTKSCSSPWRHAKGVVAWDDDGNGLVIQVTTPAWPGSGNKDHPRAAGGNTLGCVSLDDDIGVAQHFFSLKLDKSDLLHVLAALSNASVVTNVSLAQLVNNGGPADVQAAVKILGVQSQSTTVENVTLSSGVQLISKPSNLNVPPWQLVSAELGGIDLRVASWWAYPAIPSTDKDTEISCWSDSLGKPGGAY